MDNITLLWDSNIILPQSGASRIGTPWSYGLCFHYRTLGETWGVTCKKSSDDQVSKNSQSQISV